MGVIIFDLDGTLIDSAPDICNAGNTLLEQAGAAPMDLVEAKGFIGNGAAVFVQRMIAARGLDPALQQEMQGAFLALYEDAVHLTTVYPGARDCLDELKGAGHILGLCTNKPASPTRSALRHFGLDQMFGAVIAGDTLPVKKPDPAPLLACLDALGGGPAVYVGDSEVDAQTAQAAGLPFALYTPGYRKTPVEDLPHDHAFDDFTRLSGWVSTRLV